LYGLAQAWIGLNVQHDANHGAASRNHRINDVLGLGADFIGGSKWLWQEQHWTHHAYTNHREKDPDSFGAEPMLLFNDYPLGDARRTYVHRFQALFYLPVLAGYWLSSVFNPQVLDLQQRGAYSVGIKMESEHIRSRTKYAILLRALYIGTNVVTPFFHPSETSWIRPFLHIMLMGVTESLVLAVLFSLSHNFEHADRDPTRAHRTTGSQVCWFQSQVETSCTYGGFLAGCLTGGLNFQVEHHLFPRMSSAWYPYIAPTVRRVCLKHGVKYAYYPYVWQNLWSTLKYMHAAGTGLNWKDNPLSGKL
jgi:acyl-lipid (7-3)-desaturase (Delta-4 desaturase)